MDANKYRDKLRTPWKNFALRAQNVPRAKNAPAIIQMTLLVNSDGNPILWTQAKVILLEPREELDIAALNKKLSPDQMQAFLQFISENG